ncbi:histidine kinase [Methylobacterium sp. A49B]
MFPDDDDFEFVGPVRDWNLEPACADVFKDFTSPVYTTDADGWLTYYNEAAADLWGYHPELGKTRWCGCWRIFTMDGALLPFDRCPMAETIRQGVPVRGVQALLERPDGTRIPFMPYPTPLRDASGTLVAASNVLLRITRLNWLGQTGASADPAADPLSDAMSGTRGADLGLDDLTGMLQATLAALADVEFGFQSDCERLEGWSDPVAKRDRILCQLEQKRQRQREVLVRRAEWLQRQARPFIGHQSTDTPRRPRRASQGGGTIH